MKVIDLFNKIKNNEIKYGTKFKIDGCAYIYNNGYISKDDVNKTMETFYISQRLLNDEVEIIEETKEIIEESENITEKERIFNYIHRQNKMLHKAIYDYLGEPYEYKNGKITPISQLQKDKDIEEIEYVVNCNAGYEDERLNKDFSNLCNKVNINTLKINELIRKIKKIKNN